MEKTPIIIDCDPGVDDALAIILAASRPELDIRAMNPVSGNARLTCTSRNALRLKALLGLQCRVGRGAEKPLIGPAGRESSVHGSDGLADCGLPVQGEVDREYAWDIMEDEAEKAGGRLDIVALGPLTNIAVALLRHPDLKQKIHSITMMGGSASYGNVSAYAEFNIWTDPDACDLVFRSGIPIKMCGLDGLKPCGLSDAELRAMMGHKGKVNAEVGHFAEFLMKNHGGWEDSNVVIYDLITMACYVNPHLAAFLPCSVRCETKSSLCRGQTVVDSYGIENEHPNVDVLRSCEKTEYKKLIECMIEFFEQ